MGDPYRQYPPPRANERYREYAEPDDYYPPASYTRPSDPPYDRSRYRETYEQPPYEAIPPRAGVPRDYRPPRAEPEYPPPRRSGRDYPSAPAPRGPVDSRYVEPTYYPPAPASGRRGPSPSREYERSYPPEPYREEPRFPKRRPRPEEDYDIGSYRPGDYEYYEADPPAPARRQLPPAEYTRGALYEAEQPRESRPRRTRDPREPPPVKATTTKPSPPKGSYPELLLPADGIRKEVLQIYLTRFLGSDATSRGPMEVDGVCSKIFHS
ncbi:hypothetical protein AA313_de0204779 [Arthrobotrys entomopaga]|nr:hypothetical protein AA313_de0204779 [Arthrobotrys entomopaga]